MKIFKITTQLFILVYIVVLFSCCNNSIDKTISQTKSDVISENISELESVSQSSIMENNKSNLSQDEQLSIGYLHPGARDQWLTKLADNIKKCCNETGNKLLYYDCGSKKDLQVDQIKELISLDVDIIGLNPVNDSGWEEILKQAKTAGIPVIIINNPIDCDDESLWSCFISNDYYKEGQMAGQWLINYLDKIQNDETLKLVEMQDTISIYEHGKSDKNDGFIDVINTYDKFEIINKTSHGTSIQAYEIMDLLLKNNKEIDIAFTYSDDMAMGAIQAIEEAGLVPGEDIIIVSIMGTNAALEAILEGKIACSVETNPLLGDLFMEACVRLANGEEIEREIHPVDRVFDITNAQAELDARKENGYGY